MNGGAAARAKAKAALSRNFAGAKDSKGYVDWPEDNLVSGVRLEQFESDLRQGDGSEFRTLDRGVRTEILSEQPLAYAEILCRVQIANSTAGCC